MNVFPERGMIAQSYTKVISMYTIPWYTLNMRWLGHVSSMGFYIKSFSLNECIGIVWVRKIPGLSVCLSVCLCVCVCVYVSVCVEP